MADLEFARRLSSACEENDSVPAKGRGRLTYFQRVMGVSKETARKWLIGDSRPRQETIQQLASLLNVDENWLALGTAPVGTPGQRRARNARATGISNVFMGLLQLNGAAVAIVEKGDRAADFADFYAILDGRKMLFYVGLGAIDSFNVKVKMPRFTDGVTLICGVQPDGTSSSKCEFIVIPPELVKEHGEVEGNYANLKLAIGSKGYTLGGVHCPAITDFSSWEKPEEE